MRNIALVLALASMTPLLAQSSSSYRVTHTYTLGGDGSWDYIVPDPPNHRLFIACQNRVMVVDEDSGKLLGEVTGIQGAHGTSVVMFDLKTFKVLGRIPAAEDADAILYDSVSNRVFTLNGDAHSSTVIDPRAGTLIKNIPLGGKPEYGASAGDGKVYANLTDTSEVVEIDAKTATVGRHWSTAPCKQPVAIRIRIGCSGSLEFETRVPCQRNESESAAGRADDGMGDQASTIANAIRSTLSMRREATLASIHCGRLMVRASLQAFVATHI